MIHCSTSMWHKPKGNGMSPSNFELDGTDSVPIVLLGKKSDFTSSQCFLGDQFGFSPNLSVSVH